MVCLIFHDKKCIKCGKTFLPTSGKQKWCTDCGKIEREELAKKRSSSWRKHFPEKVKIQKSKRRDLGFVPLNKPFDGSEAHHVDIVHVIYIPKEIHQRIRHNVHTGLNMDKINELARRYA